MKRIPFIVAPDDAGVTVIHAFRELCGAACVPNDDLPASAGRSRPE